MTEGGLATWKVKEGQSFAAGDVLLEIETDKATMDVEAQEDGIMAKIVVEAGAKAVPVGKTIAMLAEEGDDIANVEVPKEEEPKASSSSEAGKEESKAAAPATDKPKSTSKKSEKSESTPSVHSDAGSRHFPSVLRLLAENNISTEEAKSKIQGTGLHNIITKGDVLAYLGKISSPTGSYKQVKGGIASQGAPASVGSYGGGATKTGSDKPVKNEVRERTHSRIVKQSSDVTRPQPLTADAVRSLIMGGLAASSHTARSRAAASDTATSNTSSPSLTSSMPNKRDVFDELVGDYRFNNRSKPLSASGVGKDPLKGLL
jgi:pyruvate/2-oxoglutarate dehydrogenase complex dihydrolipoamide acyltransferase (E2) component